MAANNFVDCLRKVLVHEGGYVNHPRDPGGATNRGVIQRTYDAWRKSKGLPTRSVKSITDSEVEAIYRRDYWNKVSGDQLPRGIDYATFDAGVNSGPSRGVKWLQRVLGVAQDGAAGPRTQAAANASNHRKTIVDMCAVRMSFLRGLGHWSTFGRGWTRRVSEVEAGAVAMVLQQTLPAASAKAELGATGAKAETKANKEEGAAVASGAGSAGSATQADFTNLDAILPWVAAGAAVALVVVAVVLIHKSRVNRERAKAYANAAQEVGNG